MTLRKIAYELWIRPIFPISGILGILYFLWSVIFSTPEAVFDPARSDGGTRGVQVGEIISGPAQVLDGDTLTIDQVRVRFFGIDAFEYDQSCKDEGNRTTFCGANATATLMGFINGEDVMCTIKGIDRYNRALAVCGTNAYPDSNAAMVHAGMALAYRQYSDDYVAVEDGARIAKVGAWAGFFMQPWVVRNEPKS